MSESHWQAIQPYDGNPSMSFTQWLKKFNDVLEICSNLTDKQKLARLKLYLSGRARDEFDKLDIKDKDYETIIQELKSKFENETSRTIGKSELASCRMGPQDSVFSFATKLQEYASKAWAKIDDDRLMELFLDRLKPELQFDVKSHMPKTYAQAYELASNYETLLSAKQALRRTTTWE
jgi:hypothetical protein